MSTTESPTIEDVVSSPTETCPRCHTTASWGENSWCPDCGYYPIVDKGAPEGQSWADDLPEEPVEYEDTRTALQSIPMWFWGMIAGMVGITAFSVAVRLMNPGEDGESVRGTIAILQLVIGGVSMISAHIIATRFAMSNDRRINLFDFVIAWFAIWQPTIIALPKTCKRLLAVVWGTIAVITAVTIIGGIDWAAAFRPSHDAPKLKPMNVIGAVAGAAKAQAAKDGDNPVTMGDALGDLAGQVEEMGGDAGGGGGSGKSLQEAFDELGDMEGQLEKMTNGLPSDLGVDGDLSDLSPEEMAEKLAKAAAKNRANCNCVVYGVVTNEKRVPTAFLLAANNDGVDQHVAEIDASSLSKAQLKKLIVKVSRLVQKKPAVPSERKAIWVEPSVTCRLSFVKLTDDGELEDPKFEAFVIEQRGRFTSDRQ